MNDGIFDDIFRQVYAGIDAEFEIVMCLLAKEVGTGLIYAGSYKGLGIAQLYRQRWQLSLEYQPVVFIKLTFYVWYGDSHLFLLCE